MTALQLGLDQMPDASSSNISSFISWFVFSIFLGCWIADWLNTLNNQRYTQSATIQLISSDMYGNYLFFNIFVSSKMDNYIEPNSPKVLKTIYQVLKFAAKHKVPIYRSALLTYWEEDVPSRLDLGMVDNLLQSKLKM